MLINNRSEILFLYDVTYANPNGDPVDENKPRIDEETGRNIVTDVRLKRTVRDYLHQYRNQEILIREILTDDGFVQDGKSRAEDFLLDEEGNKLKKKDLSPIEQKQIVEKRVLESCIDARLFGATLPLDKASVTFTGPVQFNMGRSLHRVKLQYVKGTAGFASGEKASNKSFREEYILPYSLIAFHGIINENTGRITNLQTEDVDLLLDALWNGTNNLISRSKMGHVSRLLLAVEYKEPGFHIGELDGEVKLETELADEEIRGITDVTLNLDPLMQRISLYHEKIERVRYCIHEKLQCVTDLEKHLKELDIPALRLYL